MVERRSRDRPRLLIVEDVHWAGQSTLALLAELAATVATCPALLVMTSRTEGDPLDPAWQKRARGSQLTTIDLGPLRREEALAMAQTLLRKSDDLPQAAWNELPAIRCSWNSSYVMSRTTRGP